LFGTIDALDAGTTSIYDGSALLTTVSASSTAWSANVTISATGIHTLTAQATNSGGTGTSQAITDIVGGSASLSGGGQTVLIALASCSLTLSATAGIADSVYGFNGHDTITLNSAAANISGGGGDTVNFGGSSGNVAGLYGTGGTWDAVYGSSGTVNLTNAQAGVTGGGNTIGFAGGSGNVVGLYTTGTNWDAVSGSNGTVYLTSAQAAVTGGGNTISFAGGSGNAAGLYNTGGSWDSVWGSNATIYLSGAQAAVTGANDTFAFLASFGVDTISGFSATDSMQFSVSDFANWAALSSHMTQTGTGTVITLNASNTVTLNAVTIASLTASQFHFV
jgi:hypothetical protein